MKNIFFALGGALLVCAASCNLSPKPIDIEIEEPPQKLVVSSFLIAPQEMALTLTRTFTALVNDDSLNLNDSSNVDLTQLIFVDSALVTVEYAGEQRSLFKLLPAVFGSAEVEHRFGETYRLRAHDFKTGEDIEAETVLLPQVNIDTIAPKTTILPNLGDTLYNFEIHFRDPAGANNYYLLTYIRPSDIAAGVGQLGQSLFSNATNQFSVFADGEYGDGNMIKFAPNTTFSDLSAGDTLIVGLSNITKGYFEFLSAYKRSGNIISQITGEPINLPTNVKNGYGYFAMIRPKIGLVVLE